MYIISLIASHNLYPNWLWHPNMH